MNQLQIGAVLNYVVIILNMLVRYEIISRIYLPQKNNFSSGDSC